MTDDIRETAARAIAETAHDPWCSLTQPVFIAHLSQADAVISAIGYREIREALEHELEPRTISGITHGAYDRGYFAGRQDLAKSILERLSPSKTHRAALAKEGA